jgi:hypothetical protein
MLHLEIWATAYHPLTVNQNNWYLKRYLHDSFILRTKRTRNAGFAHNI